MLKDKQPITTAGFNKGLFTKGNILGNEPGHSPNCMDVKWNFDESIQKRLGSDTRNTIQVGSIAAASWTVNSTGTLSTSIAHWWKMNEPSGDRASQVDNSVLSPINNPQSDSGIIGNAARFISSTSQYLYRASESNLSPGNTNFSISTWFYLTSTSAVEMPIIVKSDYVYPPVLLLHCNSAGVPGLFLDSSPSAYTVTTAGNAQITLAQSKFGGGSGLLDGTGDYITIPDSDDFAFGSGDFTIDCWVRFDSASTGDQTIFCQGSNGSSYARFVWDGTQWTYSNVNLSLTINAPDSLSNDTWYHLALIRNGDTWTIYRDGVSKGNATKTGSYTDYSGSFSVGTLYAGSDFGHYMKGYFDEFRITKGFAKWTSNFTPPTSAGTILPTKYEYYLYVNTDNLVTWRVSGNGSSQSATVTATSMGAVNTSTWYNVVAWHNSSATSHIGISGNLSVNTAGYTGTIFQGDGQFVVGGLSSSATTYFNGRIDETGFWNKQLSKGETEDLYNLGSGDSYTAAQTNYTWGMYDFGASSLRWLMVAAGTGIYASSNMGLTFVVATTNRTQTYQNFERSKNVLIATSDSYDPVIYWAGSVGTFMLSLATGSAPASKFSINYQGYLILLNQSTNKRRFAYNLETTQLTSDWTNFFDLPSSFDDEITNAFVVNRILYVSTRYRIFKLSLAGGNPDWSYVIVKEWGFVPRTVKIVFMNDRDWAVGMDWNRRMRAFDGYNEMFISNNVEADNGLCNFATSKISFSGSGLNISNAVFDPIEQEYRLNVAIGANTQNTTHSIVLNARSLALYPYSNQPFQGMCMAESSNKQFLMACDRSGYVHVLNTANTDAGIPINEYYESPFVYNKVPGMVNKGGKIDLFFKPSATGDIYFQDRADFSKDYKNSKKIINLANENVTHLYKSLDLPTTHNIYQYKLMSSSNTTEPWVLTHTDIYQQSMGIGKGN